jgi:exopolyphosphatase/pppGpp-phosphohydrolase
VADHALALFDRLHDLHDLPEERRRLLEVAALLHNVGLTTDPDRHHTVGRDILLAHPPAELDTDARRTVALTTFLHRKRITPEKLDRLEDRALYAELPPPLQEEALVLAALVHIADGLDYSQSGSSKLGPAHREGDTVSIEVTGPYADIDANRAEKKSDLWYLLFEIELRFETAVDW